MMGKSLGGRPKLDGLLGIKLEDTGEQLSGSHMVLSTDALQDSVESFRTKREKSGSLCGIIFLTEVMFGHYHIY